MHNYVSQYFLYIMFTPTYFDTSVSSSGSFKSCALLSYKLQLLKLPEDDTEL